MTTAVLTDVTLAAIVRDEIMNPAGGVVRFVNTHAPHVEEMVVVDTGSVDGTREALEELQARHRNLRVYDTPFVNYAEARNHSLAQVKTSRTLVLDADEVLPAYNFPMLARQLEAHCWIKALGFAFHNIRPDGSTAGHLTFTTRLFNTEGRKFINGLWEAPNVSVSDVQKAWATIVHFLPTEEGAAVKREQWYREIEPTLHKNADRAQRYQKPIAVTAPSQTEGFAYWKELNPQRDLYD